MNPTVVELDVDDLSSEPKRPRQITRCEMSEFIVNTDLFALKNTG
jgi:hypothetical protein